MDTISISVIHNGKEQAFEVLFRSSAYTYSFVVDINGREVRYEPDEERNLRAVVEAGADLNVNNTELVRLVGEEITRTLA